MEAAQTTHSHTGASGFDRWSRCPGSIRLINELERRGEFENPSSEYAREGTAAHEIAARCLEEGWDAFQFMNETVTVEGQDYTVDIEMVESVQMYLDYVRDTMYNGDLAFDMFVEDSLTSDIHPDYKGTADCVLWNEEYRVLYVIDFKYGKGVFVSPENNGQAMYYAVGADEKIADGHAREIVLAICQPRCEQGSGVGVREWAMEGFDLIVWKRNELIPAFQRVDKPDAPLVLGDHCKFCPVKERCPKMRETYEQMAESSPEEVKDYDNETLAELLEKTKAVKSFISALEDTAYQRMREGAEVPGHKLVNKQAARVWQKGAFEELSALLGTDYVYEQKARTPASLEKVLDKDTKKLVQQYSEKPDTGLTIAPASDKREAVAIRTAADAFSNIESD